MRVLHIADRLSERGGAYRHLLGVLAAQAQAGHEPGLAVGEAEAGVPPPCPIFLVPGLDARTRTAVALDGVERAFAPDLVHLHTVVNPHVLEWAAGRRSLITVQDHRYFCPARGKWTRAGDACGEAMGRELCAGCFDDEAYFGEVWALTEARLRALTKLAVVVLSHYMRGELVAAGLAAASVHVVPPFVQGLDRTAPPEGGPCVLFAGRLTEGKGVRDAVRAWRLSGLGLPLVMAGTGPLRGWAAAAGARVLGWVEHARLAGLYRAAAALLMPSRWQEPFGIVGLEALWMGTPVVAWRSGGIPEWHPDAESLVGWGDVEGLARALARAPGTVPPPLPARFARGEAMASLDAVYATLP